MTAARARRARALGRRLKKGNVGMQDPGWRLGCQGGVPNRVVTWGGLGGSERRPIACWGLVEAKRQFERQSWSEIWNGLLCVPFARSGDRGSRIADGILRIRKDVSCTAQDHHPSSIIISELIALSCCRIISKRRGTGWIGLKRADGTWKRDDQRERSIRAADLHEQAPKGSSLCQPKQTCTPDIL